MFNLKKKKDGPEDIDESSQQSDMHVSVFEPSTGKTILYNFIYTNSICKIICITLNYYRPNVERGRSSTCITIK